MSDHNFEKQVQQKLDELKISPATKVWSVVEAQIRKDKRRRRGVIFFPVLFLLIAAASYFIFQNELPSLAYSDSKSKSAKSKTADDNHSGKNRIKQDGEPQDQVQHKNNNTKDDSDSKAKADEGRNEAVISKKTDSNKNIKNANGALISNPRSGSEKRRNEAVISKKTDSKKNVKNANGELISNPHSASQNDAIKKNTGNKNKTKSGNDKKGQNELTDRIMTDRITSEKNPKEARESEEIITSEEKQFIPAPDSLVSKAANDSPANRLVDSITNNNPKQDFSADSVSVISITEDKKITAKKLKQSGWKWGLNVSAGISSLSNGGFFDGIIGGQKALVADVSSAAVSNPPGGAGPSAIVYYPSVIEKGFSFSGGAFRQKNIAKNWSISTGLQYNYYSTRIRVGTRVDSSAMLQNAFGSVNVDQFYRSEPVATTQDYTNRFHFVSLPVFIRAQLNKSRRPAFFWDAGISLSYLFSTNALHFDSRTGVYYKDNDLFNKLQANLSTGFSISLRNSSKMPIHIGPQLQYGFTNLMKKEVPGNKHLFYFGLNTKVFLKK